jgi:hypothetical protein
MASDSPASPRVEVLDDFADVSAWMPVASGLARLDLATDAGPRGPAMRLEFDFHGGGGFVVARRTIVRAMPETWVLRFAIRGAAPANRLELKLADPSGRNVWWRHWDAFDVPADWRTIEVHSTEIEFAWGPAGGGALHDLGAIELALAAGPGGAGTVWIADLVLEDRTYRGTPVVRATSAAPGHAPSCALDGDPATSWRSAPAADAQRLEVDFGEEREYGGLAIRWDVNAPPRRYAVETSRDGDAWTTVHAADAGDVDRSWVYLPGAVSRALRLVIEPRGEVGCGVAELAVEPFEVSRSIEAFFAHVARSEPRGHHPRWLAREGTYWTPVGPPDPETCAIMNEEGMVEIDRGTFSIEPFVHAGGRLVTWADADVSPSLEVGGLPVPSSRWSAGALTLTTTACARREAGRAILHLRYRVESATAARVRLFAAIRPFQVNPPWQHFGELGGMRRIDTIGAHGNVVVVDGARAIVALTAPSGFGAAAFEHGDIVTYLAAGRLPARTEVTDAFGYASGALAFDLDLAPGVPREVHLAAPFGVADAAAAAAAVERDGAAAFAAATADWRARLGAVAFELPAAAREHADAVRTAAGHVLINRDGPALQPGPRRYTRSWIRDGAIMAAALLRVGRRDEACAFTRWYATHQAPDGNVPCCVDRNGPDWLPEHDSHGELVYAVMECFRFTRDVAFLAEMWPAVQRAIAYLERLRATRLGPEYEAPELRARHGLLPESASHEGYLAHPVHAYWDDFWALQGFRDAAAMATVLGRMDEATRIASIGDAFENALYASIERTIAERNVPYVPGSVEWADFDPTATANAVSLLGASDRLPSAALAYTFDEYLRGYRKRRSGEIDWSNYSAYEVRIVGALVCLGRRDDAAELMEFFMQDRRPRAWHQWPEISWRDPRSPGHLGDVPHTWIGAEYVLALRTMLAYERAADRSLVLAAGIPSSWLEGGAPVAVTGLPTHHGSLDLRLERTDGSLVVSIAGVDVPAGGIVLRPPLPAPLTAVEVNGAPITTFDAASARIHVVPARVVLRW